MAATDTVVLSDYSNFLKEFYIPVSKMAQARLNPFLDESVVRFDHESIEGQYGYWPVEFPSGAGVGSRAENGANPVPDAGEYQRGRVSITTHLGVLQISHQLMKQSEGSRGAFNPAFARATKTVMDTWLRNLNRMMLGNADGKLAEVDSGSSTTSIVVDNAWGIDNTAAGSNGNGLLFLFPGSKINFFTGSTLRSAEGAGGDGLVTISSINTLGSGDTSGIITIDASLSAIAEGDYVYVAGNNSSGTIYEADGIRKMISDSDDNYGGIDTGDVPDWHSWVKYGSSSGTVEPLTRPRMNGPWNDIVQKSGGSPNLLYMGPDTLETYLELADSMQMTNDQKSLDAAGNWQGPTFRGAVCLSDPIYPETRIEYLDTKQLVVFQVEPADWLPGDVGVLQKVAGYINWTAEYVWLYNFATYDRTKLGSLRDIELVT